MDAATFQVCIEYVYSDDYIFHYFRTQFVEHYLRSSNFKRNIYELLLLHSSTRSIYTRVRIKQN